MRFSLLCFSLFLSFSLSGCGRSTTDTYTPVPLEDTACQPGTAQILVGNGYLQNLCGCHGADEDRTIYPSPGNLTCHLASSDGAVFFNFSTTTLAHQIISTGPAFDPSPYIAAPNTNSGTLFFVKFPAADTVYPFMDAVSHMTGQIFVPSP